MSKLAGKVAVVTGASKGIGAAIAKDLAANGASVVVNYSSSKEGADRVVTEIKSKGGKAIAVQGSVAKKEDVLRIFAEGKKAFGAIDILVNNAGVFQFQPLEHVTEEEFHRQYNTNVLGSFLTSQEALNHFPAGGGSIVNISSGAAVRPVQNSALYSSTKGALDTFTKALAKELGPRNIRVNAISPGGTETEGSISLGIIGSDFEKAMVAETPLGRLGQPIDIARVVSFIVSEDGGWVTGAILSVSGGLG